MMPFEAGFFLYPTSTKDKKSRPHQFWTKVLSGMLIGYALNSGGGWTGDLIIADWHDIENNVTSEVHVKSASPKKLESTNCRKHSSFLSQIRRARPT